MSYQLAELSPALGAEIRGYQLRPDLPPHEVAQLQADLDRYRVLFLRQQSLTPSVQRDIAAHFGALHTHPIYPHSPEAPEIIVLDSELTDLRDNALWHSDVSFLAAPAAAALLYAEQVPEVGGDTLWSCQQAAYQALSAPLQQWLQGLQAVHDLAQAFPVARFGRTAAQRQQRDAALANHAPVLHPVVRQHPRSGQLSLYVNEGFTSAIADLQPAESQALLRLLFQHQQRPEFQIRWHWQPGDVALWDNRNTQHYACDDYRPQRRRMRRATILGEAPLAPVATGPA